MYDNIGKKIKSLAKALFIVQSVLCFIAGIVLTFVLNPIFMFASIIAPVIVWISSWLLYGFGELIDKTCDISASITSDKTTSSSFPSKTSRSRGLETLRSSGLISEEEYLQLVEKER